MRRIIVIVVALAIVLGFLFWKFGPNFFQNSEEKAEKKQITLTILGLWDEENLIRVALDEYKKTHPNVSFKYSYTSSKNYPTRVQTKIDNNEELDIFMIHNTWLPMFLKTNALSSMPETVMSLDEYSKSFYPVITQTLTRDKKIYGIPRGIDGLSLFYNEDILKAGNVQVPQTWEQFKASAIKMTVVDQTGAIKTAGAAMGTTGNVDHFSDIIGLLFFQNPGASLENPTNERSAEVLSFYTQFATSPESKTWDTNMPSSTQAFAQGNLAFYLAPSWRAFELRQINPNLNFKTAPVPQVPGRNVAWANFWAYTVSAKSENPKEAWEFLRYFTSVPTQKMLYQEASKVRLFGLPYSRIELQSELSDDPIVGSFVNQGTIYKSWYLSSGTHDEAINDQIIKYYEDAVNATVEGADPSSALSTTAEGVAQVLELYGLQK